MKLKDKIKLYREKNGLTIVDMAKLCNVSPTTLLHAEKGYGNPNTKTMGKIKAIIGEKCR